MAKNILKEAIADAKAVREVALANAKAALEEAFTPKLQSMLSAKLSEELEEDMYDEDEDIDMDEMGMMHHNEDEMMDFNDMEEDMYEEEGEEDLMSGEIDLEEILNELELEEGDEEEEDLEEVHRVGQPNYSADGVSDVLNRASDINDNLAENAEFDLDSLLNEINGLDAHNRNKPNYNIKPNIQEAGGVCIKGQTWDDQMGKCIPVTSEKKISHPSNPQQMQETGCGCTKENAEINETKAALTAVKDELNEVNLLNSKLLYVNRIFKVNNLSESQKLRVVETLDNASNIKEAKLIYETIKDTFTISKKKKMAPKKSIREGLGMASKATGTSTAPRKAILKESNDMVTRMQKLANIQIKQ